MARPAGSQSSGPAMMAEAVPSSVASKRTTAALMLSSWMREPAISPAVEQPTNLAAGYAANSGSSRAGSSASPENPNTSTSVRAESSFGKGPDQPPSWVNKRVFVCTAFPRARSPSAAREHFFSPILPVGGGARLRGEERGLSPHARDPSEAEGQRLLLRL